MENPSAIPKGSLIASPSTSTSTMDVSVPDLSFSFKNLQLYDHSNQLGPTASSSSSPPENTSMDSNGGDRAIEVLEDSNLFLMAVEVYGLEGGFQYLQQLLTTKNLKIVTKVMYGVLDFVFEVMTNQHGHHLFVKLIESCNESQLLLILTRVVVKKDRFVHAAFTQHGSNSIKALLRVLRKSPLVSYAVSVLSSEFYSMMTDQKAKSVIVSCLDMLDDSQNEMLYLLAKRHCIALATDQEGCPALNDFISSSRGRGRRDLLDTIIERSLYLSKHSLGNYAVQHILDLGDGLFTAKICNILQGRYVELSLQKSGSHVVEKCLKSIGVRYVVSDFLGCGSNVLVRVARDQFGNYVIQTALRVTRVVDFGLHGKLLIALHENLHKLECVYGRNVLALVNKFTTYGI